MARKPANPLIRFSFEIDMWKMAIAKGSAGYMCESPNKAIHLNHKLNMARAAIREEAPNGILDWDHFVARTSGCHVYIVRKEEMDITKITDADGNPPSPEDWMRAAETPIHAHQREPAITSANVIARLGTKMPPPPETHDHTKPLDLDIAEC
jgi:hypothetical protein